VLIRYSSWLGTFDKDDARLPIGDTVMPLGNPLGVGESLSVGVISALGRDIGEGRFDHFFQTDAAINHDNSDGPMFDLQGRLIASRRLGTTDCTRDGKHEARATTTTNAITYHARHADTAYQADGR
jgi:hypothetical protein